MNVFTRQLHPHALTFNNLFLLTFHQRASHTNIATSNLASTLTTAYTAPVQFTNFVRSAFNPRHKSNLLRLSTTTTYLANMTREEHLYDARQLALNSATSETKSRKQPKKKSPLDQIRANQAKTRATQAWVSGSAFTQLEEQNEKLLEEQKEKLLEEQNEKLAVLPKKIPSVLVDEGTRMYNRTIESDPAGEVTKPPPKKKKKPSSSKKKVAAIVEKLPVEKKKRKRAIFEDEENTTECWVPCGGHQKHAASETITVKSRSVGVARIPGWRIDKFTKMLGELLFMEIVDDDEDFKILVKTEDHGLEKLTDVYVEFASLERAEELKGKIDGKMLGGRVLKVVFKG